MHNTVCNDYAAAALWELEQRGCPNHSGLILVLDLDRAGAGLCRCQGGTPPTLLWEISGENTVPFFEQAVAALMPGCADQQEAAQLLYSSVRESKWMRSQKTWLRSGGVADIPLPPLVLEDRVWTLSCSDLNALFTRNHGTNIRRMLSQIKERLDDQKCLFVPIGRLARLFLAEYLIRETFLDMPMVADERLRSYTADEDPAQFVQLGTALYANRFCKPKKLPCTLQLQICRRSGKGWDRALLPLAAKDTPYDELEQLDCLPPICISAGSSLTVFADGQMQQIPVPARLLPQEQAFGCLFVSMGLHEEKPVLRLRSETGATAQLALDFN